MSRRAVAALLALAFVLACFAFWPETAGAGPRCQSLEAARKETAIEAQHYGGEVVEPKGKPAHDYLEVVNAEPPETHLDAEAVILLVVPGKGAVIGLVSGDKVCIAGNIGFKTHTKAMEASTGQDI